jgi:four helix bundle protein
MATQPDDEGSKTRAFRFERLEIWQMARAFNKAVYGATKAFPKDELFALTPQIRRASVSVSSNIAEGSGRNSDTDCAHFLERAYGSLMEVVSQLHIALDQGYLARSAMEDLSEQARLLAAKIAALSKSLGRQPRIAASRRSSVESGASREGSSASPRP